MSDYGISLTGAQMLTLMFQDYALFKRKNADYGDEAWRKSGSIGVLVRLRDKIDRAVNLSADGKTIQVTDESILDTIRDLRIYGYMFEIAFTLPVSPAPAHSD